MTEAHQNKPGQTPVEGGLVEGNKPSASPIHGCKQLVRHFAMAILMAAASSSGCAPKGPQSPRQQYYSVTPSAPAIDYAPKKDSRMLVLQNGGKFVDLNEYVKPGFYTLFIFTTPWCGPCHVLKLEMPEFLKTKKNLKVVFINAASGKEDAESEVMTKMLQPMKSKGLGEGFPVALMYNPAGRPDAIMNCVDTNAIEKITHPDVSARDLRTISAIRLGD